MPECASLKTLVLQECDLGWAAKVCFLAHRWGETAGARARNHALTCGGKPHREGSSAGFGVSGGLKATVVATQTTGAGLEEGPGPIGTDARFSRGRRSALAS